MNTKLYNALKQLPLTKEQKEELVNAIEEIGEEIINNKIYKLYYEFGNGTDIILYDKYDNKLITIPNNESVNVYDFINLFGCSIKEFGIKYNTIELIYRNMNDSNKIILKPVAIDWYSFTYGVTVYSPTEDIHVTYLFIANQQADGGGTQSIALSMPG